MNDARSLDHTISVSDEAGRAHEERDGRVNARAVSGGGGVEQVLDALRVGARGNAHLAVRLHRAEHAHGDGKDWLEQLKRALVLQVALLHIGRHLVELLLLALVHHHEHWTRR